VTPSRAHSQDAKADTLAQRLRALGLLLVGCDTEGRLLSPPRGGGDWLQDLFLRAPIFTSALRQAAEQWLAEEEPRPRELFPGCWVAASPRLDRRRRVGYSVVVIITTPFLDCEQLAAMCQATSGDFKLIRRRLADLPPVAPADVTRTATMVSYALGDERRLASDEEALESVGQQLAESYEEMTLLYSTIQSMSVVERPDRFVTVVCEELLKTLPYAWIGARLSDDRARVKGLAGKFFVAGDPPRPREELEEPSRRLLAIARPETPLVLDPAGNPEHASYAVLGRSALVHPVGRDEQLFGVLIAGHKQGPDPAVTNVDVKLLGATATSMGIFLENAALYDDLSGMFMGTLRALTASIDAKDTYTRGHSERVALLTRQLARAVGLDEYTLGRMHIAGLVHDVGKIGVPEAVLTKPGRLTEEEFAWIKKHPEIGYKILKDIPQLRDILPGVLYHHERFDGQGYPEGLAGTRIPLVARLISLADAFDAMSSTRTYRPALSRPAVLQEILDCSGGQFDPDYAPIFVQLDFSEYDRLYARSHERVNGAGKGEAA
jgi:HD-GYP domain-containing protein (c-di-GMP phosphodiesterase class II)